MSEGEVNKSEITESTLASIDGFLKFYKLDESARGMLLPIFEHSVFMGRMRGMKEAAVILSEME